MFKKFRLASLNRKWPETKSRVALSRDRSKCVLCRTGLHAKSLWRSLPEPLHTILYRMPSLYGLIQETHSFLHRTALRFALRYRTYFLYVGPLEQGYAMPRVLSIVSSHVGASVLINSATALWALTSGEFFIHEIDKDKADPNRYADLENSLFLELTDDGKIVPRRKEISAILLIAVDGAASTVFGILNPEPEYAFYWM